MIQLTPHMRIKVAINAVDFRKGIDGLARLCRVELETDPFSGTVFVFSNRRLSALKLLIYDGHGFWLCHKRLSRGKFSWFKLNDRKLHTSINSHELYQLLSGAEVSLGQSPPLWKKI